MLHMIGVSSPNIKPTTLVPYPIGSNKVKVIYIHDINFKRRKGLPIHEILPNLWYIGLAFMLCFYILYFIRELTWTRRVNISNTFLDVFILLFGGGNLRYRHQIEKCFIGAILIAVFFILNIWFGGFLSHISTQTNLNSIDTFEKLSQTNASVHISMTLLNLQYVIHNFLRFQTILI